MTTLYAGIDVGGQSLKGIVLDQEGRLLKGAVFPTPAQEGRDAVMKAIAALLAELSSLGSLSSVGVGTPGGVDRNGVVVGMAANIPGWQGTPLAHHISSIARAPCAVRNDASMAAYAEWAARAGNSVSLLFIGLGTGIGGGYVDEGKILGGNDDKAVEIGHIIVEHGGRSCVCGTAGCTEAYASGPSMGRLAMDLAWGRDAVLGSMKGLVSGISFESSALATRALAGEVLNAKDIYEAFTRGDVLALAVDAIAAAALARAAATGISLLAPDTLVLGGGVMQGASHLCAQIASMLPGLVYMGGWEHCRVEKALFMQDAGLYGAAFYGAGLVQSHNALLSLAAGALNLARAKGKAK